MNRGWVQNAFYSENPYLAGITSILRKFLNQKKVRWGWGGNESRLGPMHFARMDLLLASLMRNDKAVIFSDSSSSADK